MTDMNSFLEPAVPGRAPFAESGIVPTNGYAQAQAVSIPMMPYNLKDPHRFKWSVNATSLTFGTIDLVDAPLSGDSSRKRHHSTRHVRC